MASRHAMRVARMSAIAYAYSTTQSVANDAIELRHVILFAIFFLRRLLAGVPFDGVSSSVLSMAASVNRRFMSYNRRRSMSLGQSCGLSGLFAYIFFGLGQPLNSVGLSISQRRRRLEGRGRGLWRRARALLDDRPRPTAGYGCSLLLGLSPLLQLTDFSRKDDSRSPNKLFP